MHHLDGSKKCLFCEKRFHPALPKQHYCNPCRQLMHDDALPTIQTTQSWLQKIHKKKRKA